MSTVIHPTAIVEPTVEIGDDVTIGPYCVISGRVKLGNHVRLISHVVMDGQTTVGEHTTIFPFASIGLVPQDLKYRGEPSELIIGCCNTIREYVTMQAGTHTGIMKTVIGDSCLFMASTHVAHDCVLGSHIIMANQATLAGHVIVEDNVLIGGLSAIHQFVRIGSGAVIGGMSAVEHDVIPFGNVKGDRAYLSGLNFVGMKRRGLTRDQINVIRQVYKELFTSDDTLSNRVLKLRDQTSDSFYAQQILDFVCAESARSLCMPKDYFE